MSNELTKMQSKHLDTYLKKSGDTLDSFTDKNPNVVTHDVSDVGWIDYIIIDNVFWIHTAFSKVSHKKTKEIWKSIIKMAKYEGCDKIQFITERNPKAFERLYNVKPIEYKMELDLTKE